MKKIGAETEKIHIAQNEAAFARALAAARMSVLGNNGLVGLDKLRQPLAYCAALRATGYKGLIDGLMLATSSSAGNGCKETAAAIDQAYRAAVDAALRT